MDYCRIKRNNDAYRKLFFKQFMKFPYYSNIVSGHVELLPDAITLPVESSEYNVYTDIMCEQLFMVKENLFPVIQLFNEDIDYRCIFLSDYYQGELHFYYVPVLPLIDCVSENSTTNLDKSVVNKVVIKSNINYPEIFRIANIKDKVVIVSLEMAESILRRKPFGVQFEKVELEGNEYHE